MESSNKTRKITVRLTPLEYAEIESKFKKTTCRKLSNYIRKQLFNKPIISTYRNESLDDFIEETIILRNELNAVGNNINQAVKKLHTLNHISALKEWTMCFELNQKKLFEKINDIQIHIQKISIQWLR
ncbi:MULTISPECIES: plasmid mobilization protein [Flavobacterium]|uniref:plasmid mobilization protein n=1 Tax=Flavobacterium TaxID=237 RepID=UPI00214D974B|nr:MULTISPECIES: plasmid mobilization relaxosome protein MobC [Flavobacterium]MCR4029494.1 plasmid mobilization relaxosome protein MobC [Flavobacterium panacis]